MREITFPRLISRKIGIAAPCSWFEEDGLKPALNFFQSKGFIPVLGKNALKRERFLAGRDEERAEDLLNFFADPEIGAIFCARGGYGSARLLDLLDYELIANNPKPLIGFSDATALQNALIAQSGLASFTGFTLFADFKEGNPPVLTLSTLENLLNAQGFVINGGKCGKSGNAEGVLIGGCLSLVSTLWGTPYFPNPEGAILVLEDVAEEPYRVDRMLTHLRLAGVFDAVAGVVFGRFYKCVAKDKTDGTIEEVIAEHLAKIRVPALYDFPYGHGSGRAVLPLGAKVKIDADKGVMSIGM